MPPRLAVRDIAFFERPVTFARPFRFGAVVINATPQAFVLVEIEVEGKGRAVGASRRIPGAKMVRQAAASGAGSNRRGIALLAADRARALSGAQGF